MKTSRPVRSWVLAAAVAGAMASAGSASATIVNWADLTTQASVSNPLTGLTDWTVTGTIAVGMESVGVTFRGSGLAFAQTSGGGTNYWTEPNPARRPYTGGDVENAPPTTDIIALNRGGLKSITFDRAVSDVYLGLVSWNGNLATFDQPFDVVSQGRGFWGDGSFGSVTPTSFVGVGELHGVIRFTGAFDDVSFTDLSENWHGIQIGIGAIAPPPGPGGIPEPTTWALMLLGAGLAGSSIRRARRRAVCA